MQIQYQYTIWSREQILHDGIILIFQYAEYVWRCYLLFKLVRHPSQCSVSSYYLSKGQGDGEKLLVCGFLKCISKLLTFLIIYDMKQINWKTT